MNKMDEKIDNLRCIPVSVPQRSNGFCPLGVVTAKESVQTPAVVSVISKLSKSNLN